MHTVLDLFPILLCVTGIGLIACAITVSPFILSVVCTWGQSHRRIRIAKNLLFGLMGFIAAQVIFSAFLTILIFDDEYYALTERNENQRLKTEVFLQIVTYPLPFGCFSEHTQICKRTNEILGNSPNFTDYIPVLFSGIVAAGLNIFISDRSTLSPAEESS